jgi:hypothetical protein
MNVTTNLRTFEISTAEEVGAFESGINLYVKSKTGFDSLAHFSLVRVQQALLDDPDGGRLFAAIVDLRISLSLLEQHVLALGGLSNKSIPSADDEKVGWDHHSSFILRMEIHDHANAFVLRFRSIWDKIMGILVLRLQPDRYDSFCQSKSKKKSFRKIFPTHSVVPVAFVDAAEKIIQSFDDRHRTPEAHGTGTLRKVSFTWTELQSSSPMALLGYWNFLNDVVHTLAKVFDPGLREEKTS